MFLCYRQQQQHQQNTAIHGSYARAPPRPQLTQQGGGGGGGGGGSYPRTNTFNPAIPARQQQQQHPSQHVNNSSNIQQQQQQQQHGGPQQQSRVFLMNPPTQPAYSLQQKWFPPFAQQNYMVYFPVPQGNAMPTHIRSPAPMHAQNLGPAAIHSLLNEQQPQPPSAPIITPPPGTTGKRIRDRAIPIVNPDTGNQIIVNPDAMTTTFNPLEIGNTVRLKYGYYLKRTHSFDSLCRNITV